VISTYIPASLDAAIAARRSFVNTSARIMDSTDESYSTLTKQESKNRKRKVPKTDKQAKKKKTKTGTGKGAAAKRAARAEEGPAEYLDTIDSFNVLLGRGNGIANFVGNARYRAMIRLYQATYQAAPRYQKNWFPGQIYKLVIQTGGRFVEKAEEPMFGMFQVVPKKRAREKISQALRETRMTRTEIGRTTTVFDPIEGKFIPATPDIVEQVTSDTNRLLEDVTTPMLEANAAVIRKAGKGRKKKKATAQKSQQRSLSSKPDIAEEPQPLEHSDVPTEITTYTDEDGDDDDASLGSKDDEGSVVEVKVDREDFPVVMTPTVPLSIYQAPVRARATKKASAQGTGTKRKGTSVSAPPKKRISKVHRVSSTSTVAARSEHRDSHDPFPSIKVPCFPTNQEMKALIQHGGDDEEDNGASVASSNYSIDLLDPISPYLYEANQANTHRDEEEQELLTAKTTALVVGQNSDEAAKLLALPSKYAIGQPPLQPTLSDMLSLSDLSWNWSTGMPAHGTNKMEEDSRHAQGEPSCHPGKAFMTRSPVRKMSNDWSKFVARASNFSHVEPAIPSETVAQPASVSPTSVMSEDYRQLLNMMEDPSLPAELDDDFHVPAHTRLKARPLADTNLARRPSRAYKYATRMISPAEEAHGHLIPDLTDLITSSSSTWFAPM
jgi:hypothetical protein